MLQNDSKKSSLIKAACVGTNRLGLANQRRLAVMKNREGAKTRVGIHVNHYGATRLQNRPSQIKFESYVAFAVQAVVNEEVYRSQHREQTW